MKNYASSVAADGQGDGGVRRGRWRMVVWAAAGLLLFAPWVAMRFTDEVNWTAVDFALAALLLFGSLAVWELATRNRDRSAYRTAVGVALVGMVLLAWVSGAVGIIGSENNEANLMYGGVLAVVFVGAIVSRLRPRGMAWTLYATAVSQALVAGVAVIGQLGTDGHNWPRDVIGMTAFFVVLWLASGRLFQAAARSENNSPTAA